MLEVDQAVGGVDGLGQGDPGAGRHGEEDRESSSGFAISVLAFSSKVNSLRADRRQGQYGARRSEAQSERQQFMVFGINALPTRLPRSSRVTTPRSAFNTVAMAIFCSRPSNCGAEFFARRPASRGGWRRPAAAMWRLASPIVKVPKWKIEAASTALAWPCVTPSTR